MRDLIPENIWNISGLVQDNTTKANTNNMRDSVPAKIKLAATIPLVATINCACDANGFDNFFLFLAFS